MRIESYREADLKDVLLVLTGAMTREAIEAIYGMMAGWIGEYARARPAI